jgi:hypothetical protein
MHHRASASFPLVHNRAAHEAVVHLSRLGEGLLYRHFSLLKILDLKSV